MNAAIRAVVRYGISVGLEVWLHRKGIKGLIGGAIKEWTTAAYPALFKGGKYLRRTDVPNSKNSNIKRYR